MKKFICLATLVVTVFVLISAKPGWEVLFNGENLDNWDKFIGTPLKGFENLKEAATPENVFSVVEQNGEKLVRISGEVNGSLATKESFENYHLQLVFKWGEKVYSSRNSGLLYHSSGDFGVALGTWMACIEHQLKHESLGDTYLMANSNCETASEKNRSDNNYYYSPGSEKKKFGLKANGNSVKKAADAEKPLGEWNTVDLYCFGRTSVHVVNGETVMVNTNCGFYDGDVIKPLSSGKIQIQSEGGELFVKSIRIEPIKKLPKEILK